MAVYRPDPPVRLPAVGVAALIALASIVPAAAKLPGAAYLRDAPAVRAPTIAVAAVFAPADPVYDVLPGATAPAKSPAYLRDAVAQRIAPRFAPQSTTAAVPPPLAVARALYQRPDAAPWTMLETWALYAPADPAYQFNGPVLQSTVPYLRVQSQPWTQAVSTPQTPVVAYLAPAALPRAHDRPSAMPWTLIETFALYAPPDPVYQFAGPTLQSVAAYRREPTPAAPLLVFAAPPTPPAFLPAPLPPRVAYARQDPTPWTMQETFALYAPADPVYQFTGVTLQSAALYRRELTSSPLPASWAIQSTPAAFIPSTPVRRDVAREERRAPLATSFAIQTPAVSTVPFAPGVRIDARDTARITLPRSQVAALVAVPSPFYFFRGTPPQVASAYERASGARFTSPLFVVQPGAPVATAVYGTPRFHGVAYDASSRIGSSPEGDGSARIGGAPGSKPRRIGGGS
jgi:hypothetical protein